MVLISTLPGMATGGSSTLPQDEHARRVTTTPSPSSRGARCNAGQGESSRNLVVCIDGTSNQFGQNNTNVIKISDMIDVKTTTPEQYVHYSSGVGTRPKSSSVLGRVKESILDKFDTAVALNIDKNIKEAYGWLADKYKEGDQIYLFGFSRGAYQVRVLAGMIHEVGLIRTPTEKQIATAYNHYQDIRPGKPEAKQIARRFKKSFSWNDLRVHFIGVWDTVSSVGLTRGDISLSMSSSACHIRHALALDERRVKFMPEYFHENPQTHKGKSNYAVDSLDVEHTPIPVNQRRHSPQSDDDNPLFRPDVKEVWFAGSHSDVGGLDRPGKSHQVGNVSLLWMRREAIAGGLALHPTDIVWMPDDLDFGISNSMSAPWRIFEYLAIKHQVSYNGAGDYAQRMHRLEPRHIMPGQKVHASILYANAYKPQATLGAGFEIPIIHTNFDEAKLDNHFWETGFFDNSDSHGDTAAKELLSGLNVPQGVAPILLYLDRLLFMLRFNDGKQSVRHVDNWQGTFKKIIENPNCAPLVRLVSIVAYYEASYTGNREAEPRSPSTPHMEPSRNAFKDAKKCLRTILAAHKHRDCPRVLALLRPLTMHTILRQRFLSRDILETLLKLLDAIIDQPGVSFAQAMDGLNSLLLCGDTRDNIIERLRENHPGSSVTRLCKILKAKDPSHLIAALRMVMTLSRYPEGRNLCSKGKPRMRELARKHGQIIGPLATEILLTLYDPNDANQSGQLDVREARVRENFASALVRMKFNGDESAGEPSLRYIFALGPDATELTKRKKELIGELKKTVEKGNAHGRTAATMTLLKLCESAIVQVHFRDHLLDVFIAQLQQKDTALFAAYALAVCLKYDGIKESMKDNDRLAEHIVGMLQKDYFEDTIGQVEGFQIFANFMQHDDLRSKVKGHNLNIDQVLETKLRKEKLHEIRTSLIYLDIFHTIDQGDAADALTQALVKKSLEHLQNAEWKVQKAGVTILSALAMTEYGVAAIKPHIPQIIKMLLPEGYLPAPRAIPERPITPVEDRMQSETINEFTDTHSVISLNGESRPPSCMMGPACTLRNLAQNKILRDAARETIQYGSLKNFHLSGTLVQEKDTSPWHVKTPDRTEVIDMIDRVIKAVDEELLSEEGLMTIGDTLPPHIQHWDRLGSLLGVPAIAILAVAKRIYQSVRGYVWIQRLLSRYQSQCALNSLHHPEAEHSVEVNDEHADGNPRTLDQAGEGMAPAHEDNGQRTTSQPATSIWTPATPLTQLHGRVELAAMEDVR